MSFTVVTDVVWTIAAIGRSVAENGSFAARDRATSVSASSPPVADWSTSWTAVDTDG